LAWWLLPAFVAAMAAPWPWLLPVLGGLGVLVSALRLSARLGARRSPPAVSGAVALGRDQDGRQRWVDPRELSAHGLILGASGAGKTTTLLSILASQISAGRPVIALDMKGSPGFRQSLAEACSAAGRELEVWTIEGQAGWNPLAHGNPTELKDKLISTERFTEPHYQRAAERYLQLALGVFAAAHGGPPTLPRVVALLDPRRLPSLLRALPPEQSEPVRDYLAGLTPDQHSAIRGLQTRLALITESQAGRFLSGADPAAGRRQVVDLRRALAGPEVVLFSLNSSSYGKLASQLGTLVVQDLVCVLGRQLADGILAGGSPATIAIDEFSGLGGDHVASLFARVREAGGAVIVATQELADLDRAAPGLRDQVIGNTALKIVHRQDVPTSARLAAQMGGSERVWEETRQLGPSALGIRGRRGTRRQVDRPILDPDRIMTLRTGEAAVISKLRGSRPAVIRVQPARGRGYPPLGVTR
jgi:hypothetical protein